MPGGALLLLCASLGQSAEGPSLTLGSCDASIPHGEALRCGTLPVPEDRARPDGRRIGLHVVVVPASRARAGAAPLFDLAGGPGLPASAGAPAYLEDLAVYREDRDVVLVDQRGTGRSNPLHCETEGQGPLDEMYPVAMVRACRERLEKTADLRQYTTVNSARDLDAVRKALSHDKIDLAGLSYGTSLALTYLRMFPSHVRAVVLLGTAPPGTKTPLYHGRNAQQALERIFEECAADSG